MSILPRGRSIKTTDVVLKGGDKEVLKDKRDIKIPSRLEGKEQCHTSQVGGCPASDPAGLSIPVHTYDWCWYL